MDDLRRRLHAAADAHQPDRDAILTRLEQGMADSAGSHRARAFRKRRQASWLKISLAGIAGVGVLGVGGLAVAVGVQQQQEPPHPAPPTVTPTTGNAVAATPKPRPSATGSTAPKSSPSPTAAASTTTSRHTPEPTPTAPAGPAGPTASDGPLTARASINPKSIIYWAQSDLTLNAAQPLTALTVELRIAQTDGVQATGDWRTEPADNFTVTVTQSDGFVVFRWILKPGLTIPAGQQVFAAQYNHSTGKRDAGKDTFRVEATANGHVAAVHGNFPAGS